MTSRVVQSIVEAIVKFWKSHFDQFPRYFEEVCNVSLGESPFKRLVIMQLGDGQFDPDNIGYLVVGKWLVEDGGIKSVPLEFSWTREKDSTSVFWTTPYIKFYWLDDRLLLTEHYGSSYMHRLKGNIRTKDDTITIDWSSTWCAKPLG